MPGTLADEQDSRDGLSRALRFSPGEGIDLMAGPYRIDERSPRSSDGRMRRLRTVFAPALARSRKTISTRSPATSRAMEAAIGPYPFEGFSVVSSPTPTGFGMPTLTYLGESVLQTALHPSQLARSRGAAKLVGERRLSGLRQRQLERGAHYLASPTTPMRRQRRRQGRRDAQRLVA